MRPWKIIEPTKYKTGTDLIHHLKKNNVNISPWIENVFKKNKNNIKITKNRVHLFRIKVKNLGFSKPTELKNIYKMIKQKGYKLVTPDLALRTRLEYKEQKTGEWLRFATSFKDLVDSDGVPHLPKLGKALGILFIETYWSYPKAIFHPHNEFVVMKNDI
ncbi:hypothetical protein OAD70_07215 [Candidatus Pelagibacter sp.]|nr:hypothetical protein [Candidatus Pelagibacter sp.]|tara:strand:- start:7282 stop:7761 length:480 start_codon:yes stop_codon:yes gene_type:complete